MDDDGAEACQCCGLICGRSVCLECEAVIHQAELDIAEAEALGHKCSVCGGPNDIGEMCNGCADRNEGTAFDWPEKHHQQLHCKDDWDD